MRSTKGFLASLAVVASVLVAVPQAASAQANNMIAGQIRRIDTECDAIQQAAMALKPTHLVLKSGTWSVVNDADYTMARQTKASITFADIYKQQDKYAWVVENAFDGTGKQTATQLCFRQSDGTLQRAKQAVAVPDLPMATAETGWYAKDGLLLQKTTKFESNDPMIAKTLQSLPFYETLPM